jgi:hypothetical protein
MNKQLSDNIQETFESKYTDPASDKNTRLDLSELNISKRCANRRIDGVVIGTLVDFGISGHPFVDYAANPMDEPLQAQAATALKKDKIGRQVLLMFIDQDPIQPVVIGLLEVFGNDSACDQSDPVTVQPDGMTATVDGERITFTAEKEIVLRCGDSSITLTRAGKILIRGSYLLSRSTGVNRIKGGVVHIN